jgi:O-antigen/teichoic acid export membrane protein
VAQTPGDVHGDISAFVRGASTRAVAQLVWKASAFATAIVIVRILPPQAAGTYFFALATGALCGLLLGLGLFQAVGREGPRWDVSGSPESTNRLFRTATTIIAGACLAVLSLVLLFSPTLPWLAAAAIAAGVAYQTLCSSLFRVRGRPRLAELNQAVIPVTFLAVLGVGSAVSSTGIEIAHVLSSRIALEVGVAVFLVLLGFRETRRRSAAQVPRAVWRSIIPLWMTGVAWAAIEQADIFLLGVLRGRAEVALYAPALRLTEVMAVAFGVLFPYLVVTSSRLAVGGTTDQIQRLGILVNKVGMVVASPIFAVALLAPEELLRLVFDIESREASAALQILGVALFAHAFLGGTSGLAESLLPPRTLAVRSVIALVVTLVADVLLISSWGIAGAAVGTLLGYLAVVGINGFLLWTRKQIRPFQKDSLFTFAIPLLAVAALRGVGLPAGLVWPVLAATVIAVATMIAGWTTTRASELVQLKRALFQR